MTAHATSRELARAADWAAQAFDAVTPPFSFRSGDVASADVLSRWERSERTVGGARTIVWRDPTTALSCRAEIAEFADFPAVEWVLHIRNDGNAPSPILADILPLDATFDLGEVPFSPRDAACWSPAERPVRLHGANGSLCAFDDFAPRETLLPRGARHRTGTTGGRSSNGALPFFNLDAGARGVMLAIGWTGNWTAEFARENDGTVRATAGMQRTRISLLPGEEIRTPRILLLFWEDGDRMRGHALLRRLILAHYSPEPVESLAEVLLSFACWGENSTERQLMKARWFPENGIPLSNFWIDAGWHGDNDAVAKANVFNTPWGIHVGNWWPNRTNYPDGLAPIGDLVRKQGMRFTLWFEPERVFTGTQFVREHPDWLLGPIGENSLFDLGNPKARAGLVDTLSKVIAEGGITCYRQDFNMDPEPFWQAADAPDRIGMHEIRHVEGLYAFWDELRRRHPGLIIDNCSSGGRRIDLETISRSIPLWRSDFQCWPNFDPTAMQGQTHGLSLWVPLSTGACDRVDTVLFRSAVLPGIVLSTSVAGLDEPEGYRTPWDQYPAEWLRDRACEQAAVRPYALGDFHPLVSFSLADDAWAAWQWDRPDLGEGAVVAIRRSESPFARLDARLRGLDRAAEYEVRSWDGLDPVRMSGAALADGGLGIEIAEKPGSRLFTYRRVR